ncbi:3'-5' exoribonuclease HELZ2-like isoform X3 [Oscarella lobularis]|uniref:3'-5' exoribonuclease HELZ2-like isoform X3 n=1 Tax=Oscarella lobularis TaxID=121494 RepID=UPI0033135877
MKLPFSTVFECKIACKKNFAVRQIVLLPSSTQSHFSLLHGGLPMKENIIDCDVRSVQFAVRFDSKSSQTRSYVQDVIVECDGHPHPYVLQTLYVDVAEGKNLKAVKQLRSTLQCPDQHWLVEPDCIVSNDDFMSRVSRHSEDTARQFPIPVEAELSRTLSRLHVLDKNTPFPKDETYFERFHALIYLEEIEIKRRLQDLSRQAIDLIGDKTNPFRGIKRIDLGRPVPSKLAKAAYIRKTGSTNIFLVSVCEIEETAVGLNVAADEFVKKELNDCLDVKVDFQFVFDRTHWLNLHASLERLPVSRLRSHVQPNFRGALALRDSFSIDCVLDKVKRHINPKVQFDPKQREAVGRILAGNRTYPHLIINGPFGTGKTFLLVEAVRLLSEFHRNARILICTQSNFAADLYVKLLDDLFYEGLFNANLFRVCFASRKGSLDKDLLDCYFCFLDDAESTFSVPPNSELGNEPLVVVTTLLTSAKLRDGHFSHIIIDEAAQATEPESIAPLALAGSRTALVLAGDCVQTSPPVSSSLARGGRLQRSLFRRLYKSAPDSLIVNLVTNHRSQRDLFALIARIFYGADAFSPDQARSPIQAVHPTFHPFSFFICDDGLAQQGGTDGSYYNQSEATLIVNTLDEVFDGWPQEWGECSPQKVCVVSSEFTQVQYIRQLLRHRGDNYKKVNVITHGGIQGQEFRVVLVSTVMTSKGYRQDYEKSPNFFSDKKVVNTVLTRAKSLVIVFGDPDCLTKSKIDRIWQQYIEACTTVGAASLKGHRVSSKFVCKLVMEKSPLNVEAQSFVSSFARQEVELDDADDDATSESSVYEDSCEDETDDEMARIYREEVVKSFRSLAPKAKEVEKRVMKQVVRGSVVRWTVAKVKRRPPRERLTKEDVGERVRHGSSPAYPPHLNLAEMEELMRDKPEAYLKCVLHVSGSNAHGYSVDSEEVFVEGRQRRNRAFDGEEVLLKIDSADEGKSDDKVKTKRGSVVGIFQKRRPKRFVCQLSKEDKNLVVPIDQSHPIFANGPSTRPRHDDGVRMFSVKGRRIVDEESVPLCDVEGKLFVVQYLSWRPEFPYPLGIAVECIEAATTLETGRRLLEIQYEVDGDSENTVKSFVSTCAQDEDEADDDDVVTNAFTIDPEHSRDLDDALNVERNCNDCAFKVGVYIADVAHHVAFRSDENKQAEQRGTSVYDSQGSVQQSMLPRELSSNRCSLLPFRRRRVIAGHFCFDENLKLIEDFETTFEEVEIKSCCQLSYAQAQAIICGEKPKINCRLESRQRIFNDVVLLSQIAGLLRERRLASRRFFRESDRFFEAEAHELVEEFMILMNSEVARRLLDERRHLTILYSQRSPRPEKVSSWLSTCGPLVNASQRLVAYGQEAETLKVSLERQTTLRISKALWYRIRSAKSLDDRIRLACCDDFVPQLAVCQSHYFRSRQRSVYTCDETDEGFPTHNYDFQRPYTHFTSPIRRYVDLVMQRLLKKYVIENSADEQELKLVDYKPRDIARICINANFRRRAAIQFQRDLSLLEFADEVQTYPVVTIAVVEEITGNSIGLFVPDCPSMPAKNFSIKLMSLTASSATPADDFRSVSIKWNVDLLNLPTRERREVRVNPPVPECEFGLIQTRLWRDFTDSCIRGDSESTINRLIAAIETDPRSGLSETEQIERQGASIRKTIALFDLLSVQISSRMQRGVIRPYIQLVNFSDGLSICLDHNERPGLCFGPPLSRSSLARRRTFSDFWRYYEYWSSLVQIEGATASVKSSPIASPTLIREMAVVWDAGSLSGKTIMNLKFAEENKIAFSRGDYVCLRYFNLPMGKERPPKQGSLSDAWKLESNQNKYHFVLHCTIVDSKERYSQELKRRKEIEGDDFGEDKDLVKIKFRPCFGSTVTDVQKHQLCQLLLEEETLCMAQTIHCSLPFRRMRQNLERLLEDDDDENNILAREMAFGDLEKLKKDSATKRNSKVGDLRDTTLTDVNGKEAVLNDSQYSAVNLALEQNVTLIQGPPGTGKTVTGVHIAWLFAMEIRKTRDVSKTKRPKLFVCAPSNEAVDLIARKLKRLVANQSHGDDQVTVLRVYSESIAQAACDGPWIFNRYKPSGLPDAQSKENDDLHDISLHRMIRDVRQADEAKKQQALKIRKKENDFRQRFESNGEDKAPSKREVTDYRNLIRSAERPEVERADIILCTCIQAASRKFHDIEKSHCIVDEAGQCSEPETLVAINGTTKRIVLIGDHKQLRPVVQNNDVAEVLSISMFERLFVSPRVKESSRAVMLTTQYRMHKDICAFPSMHFYEKMLKTASEVERREDPGQLYVWPEYWKRLQRPRQHQQPKCFIHIDGEEKVTPVAEKGKGGDESKSNAKEVEMIVQVIKALQAIKQRLCQHSVRVITPYTAQRDAIVERLKAVRKPNCFSELKIGSVAETQGGEADFVILSTVRSMPKSRILPFPSKAWLRENLGFVVDDNQINVAITRAKFGLIIVGNQHLLSVNAMWRELIRSYREQRCVLDSREARKMFS